MNRTLFILLGVLLTAAGIVLTAQATLTESWVRNFNGSTESDDVANKVAVDSAGNVIAAGDTSANVTGYDWLVIKYSNEGVALWTNTYNGVANGNDNVSAIALDSSDNIYVTGKSDGVGTFTDYVTIAYSSAGIPLWTNRYNAPRNGADEPSALAVDGFGNVIVTGASQGIASFYNYTTIAYSSAGAALWTNRYDGPGSGDAKASAVVVDANGKIFVTGYSRGLTSGNDYATIAYSSAGLVLWTNRYNGPANSSDGATAMAVDENTNIVVTGVSTGTNGFALNVDYTTIAYSSAGVPLWTNRYNNSPVNGADVAVAIGSDGGGHIIVTGYSEGDFAHEEFVTIAYTSAGLGLWTNKFGVYENDSVASSLSVASNGNVFVTGMVGLASRANFATVAYTNSGGAMWTNRYGRSEFADDRASAVVVDQVGKVFVTGTSWSVGNYDYAKHDLVTIAYSVAGFELWINLYNGVGNGGDASVAVSVNDSGNAFVTGYTVGGGGVADYATIAYSKAGVGLWTNYYNGPWNGEDKATALAVSGNNVFTTGASVGSDGLSDYATIAYSAAGLGLWTNRYSGSSNSIDQATALAIDSNGRIVVTGYSGTGGLFDYATVAYSPLGVALWTNRYNGPGNNEDRASCLAASPSGQIFVTGYSRGTGSGDDYATIAYSSSGNSLWTNRLNGPANGEDRASAIAVDGSGNVVVTGSSAGNATGSDFTTVAYTSAGAPLWTNRFDGFGGDDVARSIAVDGNGNLFVTGYSVGSDGFSGEYATIAYSRSGLPLWTNRYSGPGDEYGTYDEAQSVVVDGSGNVFVTGYSIGSDGTSDFATIVYSASGIALCTNRYEGAASEYNSPAAKQPLAVGTDGSVWVTGQTDADLSIGSFNDFTTVKYVSQFPPRIELPPTNQTVSLNQNAFFGVTPGGTPPFHFQWLFNSTNLLMDATNQSVEIFQTTPLTQGNYSVIVTNTYGSVTSIVASLSVLPPSPLNRLTALLLMNGSMQLSYIGLSNLNYALDRTFNLEPADWIPQFTNTAGPDGLLVFTNAPNPNTNNFWRIRSVP